MTLTEQTLRAAVTEAFTSLVEVSRADDSTLLVLTPVESLGGDAVPLLIRETTDGIKVSDSHAAMWGLHGALDTPAFKRDLSRVEAQYDVDLMDDAFVAAVGSIADLGDACLRVALASAAFTTMRTGREGTTRRPKAALRRRVATALRAADVEVTEDARINGASGHEYRVELFVPRGERVVAVMPRIAFDQAQQVHSKLADISSVNGFTAVAVVDGEGGDADEFSETTRLLTQVAEVVPTANLARWVRSVADES